MLALAQLKLCKHQGLERSVTERTASPHWIRTGVAETAEPKTVGLTDPSLGHAGLTAGLFESFQMVCLERSCAKIQGGFVATFAGDLYADWSGGRWEDAKNEVDLE